MFASLPVILAIVLSYFAIGYDLATIFGFYPPWFIQVALAFVGIGWSVALAIVLWLLHFIPTVHFPLYHG